MPLLLLIILLLSFPQVAVCRFFQEKAMSSLITKRSSRRRSLMERSDDASSSQLVALETNNNTSIASLSLSPSSPLLSNASSSIDNSTSFASVGCPKKYADKRTMTPFQEKINALTILPSGVYCLYYLLTGKWIRPETLEWATEVLAKNNHNSMKFLDCIPWRFLPSSLIPSLPPPTILAICIGVLVHCPCSFLYHWKYAANPDAAARLLHWSRRLDHSAIHACSMVWSFGLSAASTDGNYQRHLWFFAFNVIYNLDSIRFHWEEDIKPRRNQLRILGSMLLYTSPLLWQQQFLLFGKIWAMFVLAVWFFVAYPIGGWSHAAFHIIMIGVPPLLLERVADLEATGAWSQAAATCAVLVTLQQQQQQQKL